MSKDDARFEEAGSGTAKPLRLKAESAEDLAVISSLLQDAVGKAGDVTWLSSERRLIVQLNRFRWEAHAEAASTKKPFERVRSALAIEGVGKVRARGLNPSEKDQVYDLLALIFAPGDDCDGTLTLTLAGGGEVAVEVECLDVSMSDLSAPWPARAQAAPDHPV